MPTLHQDPDERERLEPRPLSHPLDVISMGLGGDVFVRHHRFGDLYITTPMGRSPRLSVSRYYWGLNPPVAVDFFKEIKRGRPEYDAKRAYCARLGIRYILAQDEWDEDAVARPASEPDAPPAKPLLTAPRRKPGPKPKVRP